MITALRSLSLVSLLALLAIGIGQGGHGHGPGGAGSMPMAMGAAPSDELGFLQHMIPHHREAVASAEQLLERTERPELQALLRDIIDSQTAEIELMRGWIDAWYPAADAEAPYEPMMRDLADAPVEEQERAFLEDMLRHHMMAVRDAQMLLNRGLAEHAEVAALARSIVTEQRREMQVMRDALEAWFDGGAHEMMRDRPGMHGMGAHGMGAHGMGRHGAHEMMGDRPGMHGMGRHGAHAMMAGALPLDLVEALARAFLAGAGSSADAIEVAGPQVTYEVTVRDGDRERVLIVDGVTRSVTEAPAE